MRLIDVDKLNFNSIKGIVRGFVVHIPLPDILRTIREAPAVDAVPVVRCKDCEHYKPGELFVDAMFCYRDVEFTGKKIGYMEPEDFCSYGERRGD